VSRSMRVAALAFALIASPLFAQADDIVPFHIPAGTAGSPWNTANNPVVVTVGQTLRIYNDDSVVHFLHTPGAPCPHGTNEFGPGQYYDCVISLPHNASDDDIYDHNYGPDAQFYIQANQ
jgi:hypothetical protein